MGFTAGQRVRFHNGSRFEGQLGTVQKVLPKNIDVKTDAGRVVRANPYFLTLNLDATTRDDARVTELPIDALPPDAGTLVKCDDPRLDGWYVVLGDATLHGRTVAKIAKLGGDGGRYWRMPANRLTVVKVEDALFSAAGVR